ncbi:thioredoxin family protein [Pontibacter sp. HSC-14F20]|uniref:thioredoxin family protein n=1 Tax=Pontibacter sp. HSC-14F20 TaxID=2864136 RepID=UPI001C7380DB|nr:thioredoxin family protein [Pontibacter sp. HSC-14F20]MBX0332744.1 thioredoxin family protein [Pontibacter sp. HSC-14F20]
MSETIIMSEHLAKAMTYTQYRELIDTLLAENKTSGTNHSEAMVEYTRVNAQRMRRVEKTTELDDELVDLMLRVQNKMIWVIVTEAWCGDAAQTVPALVKIADASPLIDVKLLLRDEHPDVIDAYLTNGGRSIPKLIVLDAATMEELGTWGPRPAPAQELFMNMKAQDVPYTEFVEKLHGWYGKDRSKTLLKEFKELIPKWARLQPIEEQPMERL